MNDKDLLPAHPADLSLSPPPRFKQLDRRDSPDYEDKPKGKLSYKERYELEHTYAAHRGMDHCRKNKER